MSAQENKKRPAAKGGKGTKASARSSKTDHVLNLLGGGHSAPPPEEPAVQTGQAAPPEQTTPAAPAAPAPQADQTAPAAQAPAEEGATPAAQPQTPPPASPVLTAPATPSLPILEVARNNNQRLADTICSALEQALAEEEGGQEAPTAPAAEPEAVPTPEPAPQEAAPEPTPEPPPQEPAPTPEPVLQEPEPAVPQEPEPEPVSQEPAPEPETPPTPAAEQEGPSAPQVSNPVEDKPAASPSPSRTTDQAESLILPGNALFLNVLELLVDEAMERYGTATGLCPCARCRADAKALALSRLPAKYVVLPAPAMPPMISLYREEFSSDVLAQILYACNQVKTNPRHPQ